MKEELDTSYLFFFPCHALNLGFFILYPSERQASKSLFRSKSTLKIIICVPSDRMPDIGLVLLPGKMISIQRWQGHHFCAPSCTYRKTLKFLVCPVTSGASWEERGRWGIKKAIIKVNTQETVFLVPLP